MRQDTPEEISIFPERKIVYATFAARLWAAVIDGVLVLVAWFIVVSILGGSATGGLINLLILLLYYPLMEGSSGQATLGKTGLNIKVTDMDGEPIGVGRALARHLARLLSVGTVFVGYFMMLWSGKRQTLHDRVVGTLVLSTESK